MDAGARRRPALRPRRRRRRLRGLRVAHGDRGLCNAQGLPHARCVVLIEACEESGSYDLPAYIEHLAPRIGDASLVVCLDSGCGNYDQLWSTTSLRGLVAGDLTVEVLREGVHSGDASGIVPSSFRVLRMLLSRLEDEETGAIKLEELHVAIPRAAREQAQGHGEGARRRRVGEVPARRRHEADGQGQRRADPEPHVAPDAVDHRRRRLPAARERGQRAAAEDDAQALAARAADGRRRERPPRSSSRLLEKNPPYGAKVTFEGEKPLGGWNAPAARAVARAKRRRRVARVLRQAGLYMGEGGTIPFMDMLGRKFPQAQFLITGVLGPHSNAHGPNEFLHLPTARKLTCCVAQVVHEHSSAACTQSRRPKSRSISAGDTP